MQWSADFETTINTYDCRVWAWCCCDIGNEQNIYYGNKIESFISFCEDHAGDEFFFHNLAFDGEFIICWLLNNGFEHTEKLFSRSFKTLISQMGKFYQIEICFEKKGKKKAKKVTLKDSLKKLPMSVDAIAKAFDLPINKLNIDYKEYRSPGHELTTQERDYIKNDVQIVSMALNHQFDEGLTKLTVGSDAISSYRGMVGGKWISLFPMLTLEMDELIRRAYKGGWTYANPKFQGVVQSCGSVYDVNSLYPDVMYNCPLPYGVPLYFKGQYKQNDDYPLYIQFISCCCKIKKDHLPTIQIKNSPFYSSTEYLTDTEGIVDLALTSVDLELMFKHYDVDVYGYHGGFMFKAQKGMFKDYIDHWSEIKANSKGGKRQLAKLMLNSLYGKFASNPDVTQKVPYLKDDGSVGYKLGECETRDPVYTPIGCFVTAWARNKTIATAQKVYSRFMYADTDSIHVLGTEPVDGIEVHPSNLGAWKHESNFLRAKYVRAKTYIEEIYQVGEMVDGAYTMVDVPPYNDVKCAGLPGELKNNVNFENFESGLKIKGKLRPIHCPGGIVLQETTFTVK